MKARLLGIIGLSAVLFASTSPEVWNNKDFTAWTVKDAQQIMTNSPWAKEKPMPISGRPGVVEIDPSASVSSAPTAALGNPANTTNGPNMSSAAAGSTGPSDHNGQPSTTPTPSLSSAPVGAPATQPVLKYIWASALPVRLAVLKLRSPNAPPAPEQVTKAQKEWPHYVIAVVGLPAPEAGSDTEALAKNAALSLRGKRSVAATKSEYRRVGSDDVYFFSFDKAALPITASDSDVEFKATVAQMKLSQKFHLAAMTYQGQLAL